MAISCQSKKYSIHITLSQIGTLELDLNFANSREDTVPLGRTWRSQRDAGCKQGSTREPP